MLTSCNLMSSSIGRRSMALLTRGWSVLLVVAVSACGSSSTGPSTTLDLTNTWTGSNNNSGGTGTITEHLTQSGNTVSGTFSGVATGSEGTVTYSGTLSGTLSGSTLTYSGAIPVGGYSGSLATCSLADAGTATVTNTSIKGTYTGTLSCDGVQTPVTDGAVNLTVQ